MRTACAGYMQHRADAGMLWFRVNVHGNIDCACHSALGGAVDHGSAVGHFRCFGFGGWGSTLREIGVLVARRRGLYSLAPACFAPKERYTPEVSTHVSEVATAPSNSRVWTVGTCHN